MNTPDDILLRMLNEHHLPCPVCGYDLHRLTSPRCTECGRALALRIVLTDPPPRSTWVAALIASGVNASVGLLLLILASRAGLNPRREFPTGKFFDVAYHAQFVLIAAPVALLLMRKRFTALPTWLQAIVAVTLGAWGLMMLIALAINIR